MRIWWHVTDQLDTLALDSETGVITVLVVEDDPVQRAAIRLALGHTSRTFAILEATTLQDARKQIDENNLDVVLLDLSLPDSQSMDTFIEVSRRTSDIPIIVVSAEEDREVAVEAVRHGAQDFLVKSTIDADRLVRSIKYSMARVRNEALRRQLNSFVSSEWQFREAFEAAPIGIFLVDETTRFIRANDSFCKLVGYTEQELKQMTSISLSHPADVPDTRRYAQMALEDELIVRKLEKRYITKSGDAVWVRVSARSLGDERKYGLVMVENFSEEKRATEFLNLQLIVGKTVSGSSSLGAAAERVTHAMLQPFDAQYCELWNLQTNTFHVAGACASDDFDADLMTETAASAAVVCGPGLARVCQDGKVSWIDCARDEHLTARTAVALTSGLKHAVAIPIMSGISHFGLLIVYSRDEFGDDAATSGVLSSVAHMLGQFMHRKAAEERAMRAVLIEQREEFISTLAHDLKTPIAGANRMFDLLVDGVLGELAPKQVDVIKKLKQSNNTQLRMIQNLLQMYRLESGANVMELSQINVTDLINSAIAGVQPIADAQKVPVQAKFEYAGDFIGDYIALGRVMQNLLDNALKYTSAPGMVEVCTWKQNDSLCISVRDTGKGIPAELRTRMFQRFSQGSGRTSIGGSGIGLYLCKQIVDAHGGTIKFDSTITEGTKFIVCLPIKSTVSPQGNR